MVLNIINQPEDSKEKKISKTKQVCDAYSLKERKGQWSIW